MEETHYTIEVYVACDNYGDHATGNNEEHAMENYHEEVGSSDRIVKVVKLEIEVDFPPVPTHKIKLKLT